MTIGIRDYQSNPSKHVKTSHSQVYQNVVVLGLDDVVISWLLAVQGELQRGLLGLFSSTLPCKLTAQKEELWHPDHEHMEVSVCQWIGLREKNTGKLRI